MGYMCIYNHRLDCDGCMRCKKTAAYYCPICGNEIEETVYIYKDGEVIGCENCVMDKPPWEAEGRLD